MKPDRTVVIPAYAEAKYIESTLVQLRRFLLHNGWLDSTEVIVVTADAADHTSEITAKNIKSFPLHAHINPGKRAGKGRDVKAGLKAATADQVLFMDADLATPLSYVEPVFKLLKQNGGMVIGVRHLKTMHKTIYRRLTSRLSNTIIRLLVDWRITDSQCGFKAFDRRTLDIILPRSVVLGWGFDFEFIAIARKHKLPITSLTVEDWHDPKPEGTGLAGDSQLVAMKQSLIELLRVKWNLVKGRYR